MGIEVQLENLIDSRYKLTLHDRSKKKLSKLKANALFMVQVHKLRIKYKIPDGGFKYPSLPKPYSDFERDIRLLRKEFNLSNRWHLPISLFINDSEDHSFDHVCGLRFYKATTTDASQKLLVQVFGDTTEKEYREAWKGVKRLKKTMALEDAEQFRYVNYKLDELIDDFYKKDKSPKTISEKLNNYFIENDFPMEYSDKYAGEEYIRVRINRIKKRKCNNVGLRSVSSLEELKRINK